VLVLASVAFGPIIAGRSGKTVRFDGRGYVDEPAFGTPIGGRIGLVAVSELFR